MMSWIQRRPLVAALAAALVALVVAIGFETGFGTHLRHSIPQESSKKAPAPEAKLLPPMVAVAPEQAYPETTARPLFTPTRRPAPPENVASKPAFNRGQFVLQGVIVVGEEKTALLKEKASGKIHRVESGKDVNGITVERIDPTEVTLAMGGEKEKLALVVQKPEAGGRGVGAPLATFAPPPDSGPFGAIAPAQPPAAAPPTAEALAAQGAAAAAAAAAAARNPAGRPVARSAPAGTPGANTPSSQPMSPEELLARRRARRSQPTQ